MSQAQKRDRVESVAAKSRRRLTILSKRSDFLRTFRFGRKIRPADWVVMNVVVRSGEGDGFRCGWTCPRAVGPAVIRNRLKRWSREWLRAKLKSLDARGAQMPPVDLNLGFRPMPDSFYKTLTFDGFSAAMNRGWVLVEKLPHQNLPRQRRIENP